MIKTPEGIAVLRDDSHISRWVEIHKSLSHDGGLLPTVLTYIHPGDVVVDVGAFIGDHTFAYLQAVGKDGTVYAFEPNPDAFECLVFNCPKAKSYCMALGYQEGTVNIIPVEKNVGAGYTVTGIPNAPIRCITLDSLKLTKLNLLKIDAEGDEFKILLGGWQTIMRCRPIMVIEVNDGHLRRQGNSEPRLLGMVDGLGYTVRKVTAIGVEKPEQYDILCQPRELPK